MISTVLKLYRLYLFVALLVTVALTSACYTILKHPRLAHLDYRRPDNKQCAACHSSDEIWGFHHLPYAPTTDVPWWYERYWGYEDSTYLETVPLPHRPLSTPAELSPANSGVISTPSEKQDLPTTAPRLDKKEKGDGNAKDKPRRPFRSKNEKKKKDKKKKP
jgi:hypothetical protein